MANGFLAFALSVCYNAIKLEADTHRKEGIVMENYTVINKSIHRLTTVYKDIFTTVYALKSPNGDILFDAASYDEDVDEQILPFLNQLNITPETLKYIFISHNHTDHSGGLQRLMRAFPNACIVSGSSALQENYQDYTVLCPKDGDVLLDTYRVVTIPGHTVDSAALLDMRTMTLITGDCLQLYGIRGSGNWASNISLHAAHLEAVEKVRAMGVESILAAHNYEPCGYRAVGKAEVNQMLDACVAAIQKLKQLIVDNPSLDDEQIRQLYNEPAKQLSIGVHVVAAMRNALQQGQL